MKHVITIQNSCPPLQYKGFEVLNAGKGSIVKLIDIDTDMTDTTPLHQPLMVTCDLKHPLVDLTNGSLFGCNIEGYTFEKMHVTELKLTLN